MNRVQILKSSSAARSTADWGVLTWFASGALGNSTELTVGRCVIFPGQSNPPHRHPNCTEILVVLAGRIAHTSDDAGGEIVLEAGDTITIPPGLLHRARNLGDVDAVLMVAYSSADRQVQGE